MIKLTRFLILATVVLSAPLGALANSNLANQLSGNILLQVEEHGEAWYVDPVSLSRYYLQNGEVAYEALREFGLGITNIDLAKIPVGIEERFEDVDTDGDGLADSLEDGLGTNKLDVDSDDDGLSDGKEVLNLYTDPLGEGSLEFDSNLIDRLNGRILIQVESHGEAWYLNPSDQKRYYMSDGDAAYQIMRFLSLGIANSDLETIPVMGESDSSSEDDREYTIVGPDELVSFSTIDFELEELSEEGYLFADSGTKVPSSLDHYFIVLDVNISNTTNESLTFDRSLFVLVDTGEGNQTYLPIEDAAEYIDNDLGSTTLEPGQSYELSLIYDAPSLEGAIYLLPMDKSGTNETYMFSVSESSMICSRNEAWSDDDCDRIASDEVWVGMEYYMLLTERGSPDTESVSNYGGGDGWQWCWLDENPMCVYDWDDDRVIDAYN